MPTFVSLMNYTAQGIANIKDAPSRIDAARDQLAGLGVTIKDVYLTMGEYDLVLVVDAPDHIAVAKALLATGAQGNVSTTTMTALTEEEFRGVITEMA